MHCGLVSGIVANLEGRPFRLGVLGLVVEVQRFLGVIGEVGVNVLEGFIDSVMALEGQEPCRGGHRAHRTHEADPLAGVEEGTGGIGMDCELYFLHHDVFVGLLWVGDGVEVLGGRHELGLVGRTGVLAPEPLQIDGANITTTSLAAEDPVDLDIGSDLGDVVVGVAAA